jgi:hypothetical protein
MEIKDFIKIYDDILPLDTLGNLIRFANVKKFNEAAILGPEDQRINFDIRRTYVYNLSNMGESMSDTHWALLLQKFFRNQLIKYSKDVKTLDFGFKSIIDISILKYENTGFYTWHTDHAADVPRTMSCILLLNNDYEGGNLCFRNPDGTGEWEVEVKPNRMIVWPSNFLYPHTVKPVTKGIRYSVVAWAL